MSANKHTVQKFMDAVSQSDHENVLSCLTDDVEWVIPGVAHTHGKAAFGKQIDNEGIASCTITVTRLTEENNVVIAEGRVQIAKLDGGLQISVFCDVFEMQETRIKHLTAYLMEVHQ